MTGVVHSERRVTGENRGRGWCAIPTSKDPWATRRWRGEQDPPPEAVVGKSPRFQTLGFPNIERRHFCFKPPIYSSLKKLMQHPYLHLKGDFTPSRIFSHLLLCLWGIFYYLCINGLVNSSVISNHKASCLTESQGPSLFRYWAHSLVVTHHIPKRRWKS